MRWAFLAVLLQVASALELISPLPHYPFGIGIVLDQTHGTASIAFHDGNICNVAVIPGNAAYLEYMYNVTTGPVSSTGEAIAFPSYKPALNAQNQTFTPLETMFIELQRAVSAQASRSDYSWYRRKISISLPLSFADIDYADRFEFDLLNSMLSLRYNNVHSYEIGAAALSRRGGICLPSEHPLILGTTKSQQPLQRFTASAQQALTVLADMGLLAGNRKVRLACPSGPSYRHVMYHYDYDEEQPIKQLTIDGRLD